MEAKQLIIRRNMQQTDANGKLPGARRSPVAIILLAAVLVLVLAAADLATALSLANGQQQQRQVQQIEPNQGAYNDFVANLVDEYLVNNERLKKSKATRAVKQTLRFGRRSDPSWYPEWAATEQQALEDRQRLGARLLFSEN